MGCKVNGPVPNARIVAAAWRSAFSPAVASHDGREQPRISSMICAKPASSARLRSCSPPSDVCWYSGFSFLSKPDTEAHVSP